MTLLQLMPYRQMRQIQEWQVRLVAKNKGSQKNEIQKSLRKVLSKAWRWSQYMVYHRPLMTNWQSMEERPGVKYPLMRRWEADEEPPSNGSILIMQVQVYNFRFFSFYTKGKCITQTLQLQLYIKHTHMRACAHAHTHMFQFSLTAVFLLIKIIPLRH